MRGGGVVEDDYARRGAARFVAWPAAWNARGRALYRIGRRQESVNACVVWQLVDAAAYLEGPGPPRTFSLLSRLAGRSLVRTAVASRLPEGKSQSRRDGESEGEG